MGFDVHGQNAQDERGKYFRSNVWWWRKLWKYTCANAPELSVKDEERGNYNDGFKISGPIAKAIGFRLLGLIESGETATIEKQIKEHHATLPEDDLETHYPFTVDHVKEWATFLVYSGGIEIW